MRRRQTKWPRDWSSDVCSSELEIEENYVPRFPQVKLLTDKDARIIKDTFLIAKKKRDYATMRRLKRKLETVMDVQSDMRAQEFIETVMKDFNYYTQKL